MRKKNSSWHYCNICEKPMREKKTDGLCINCHLFLCFNSECSRCSDINEMVDLLIQAQNKRLDL